MSRFLIATYPSPGHVVPAAPVVSELTGRGHEVRWYTGRRFAEVVDGSGARFCAMPENLDWDYNDLNAAFPGRAELKGLKQNQFDLIEIFVRPLREHLRALKALLVDEPADVFVSHTVFLRRRVAPRDGWAAERDPRRYVPHVSEQGRRPLRDGAGTTQRLGRASAQPGSQCHQPGHCARSGRRRRRERSAPNSVFLPYRCGVSSSAFLSTCTSNSVPPGSSTRGPIFLPTSISLVPQYHRCRRSSLHRAGGRGFQSRSTWCSSRRGPSPPTRPIYSLHASRDSPPAISSSSPRPVVLIQVSSGNRLRTRLSRSSCRTPPSCHMSTSWCRTAALVRCSWPLPTVFRRSLPAPAKTRRR